MCSVSNQTPVQLQLAFKLSSSSYSDTEPFLQKTHLKMAQPLIKIKRYSHKLRQSTDANVTINNATSCNNNDNQKTLSTQTNILSSHAKKPSKTRPRHTVSISSSLDTSSVAVNENEYESRCRSNLVSPRCSRHYKHRKSYRQATDTDELLRKVSVQLMRAQSSDVSRKSDKSKTVDVAKNLADSERSVTMSSIESPKFGLDNDISLTSDDCGQFSGSSTPDQQVLGQSDAVNEDQLRLACEHIIEQQRKAWIAFKKSKKNGRQSLTRTALDHEAHPLKENHLSNISCDTINIRCKNESGLLKVSNNSEEGHISSEQFDSGHGSSEEHEITSKTEWFPNAGNTNAWPPVCRPHYRYHLRRQKGLCPVSKQTTCNTSTDSVPPPLETVTGPTKAANPGEQRLLSKENSTEFKLSSYTARYSRPTTSKTESIPAPSSSPSPSPSYLSSHICSGLTSCSSSSSSSIVNLTQVTSSCCPESPESACTVLIPTEETLFNSSSPRADNKSPKQKQQRGEKINNVSLSSSTSSLAPPLSHTSSSKNSSKKESNKSNVKLSSTLTRSCISCGFIANACSKFVQIRKTISGKTSKSNGN